MTQLELILRCLPTWDEMLFGSIIIPYSAEQYFQGL